MSQELTHKQSGNALHHASPEEGTPSGLYKIRIPKGAQSWHLVTQTGNLPVPCSVLMSIDAPPNTANAVEMGPDNRNAMQRLWAGETLRSDTPAHSGVLSVSQPEMGSPWRADRERWIFLQFDFGPYKCRSMQGRIDLHDDAAPPVIDKALYARAHKLVERVGLVQSMYQLSGCTSNDEFDRKVIDSGVWPGLIEMVRLAEEEARPAKVVQ